MLANELEGKPFGPRGVLRGRERAEDQGFEMRRRITVHDVVVTVPGIRVQAGGRSLREELVAVRVWIARWWQGSVLGRVGRGCKTSGRRGLPLVFCGLVGSSSGALGRPGSDPLGQLGLSSTVASVLTPSDDTKS